MTIMKVLLLNGSPRKEGCTYTALTEIAETLKKNGVEAEIFQAGDPSQENVAAAAAIMKEADALIVGSPVYWASPSGQIIEFMDKFAVSLKDIGNAHSLSLHDTLIHLHNIHGKNILQIIGDRRFTSSHKSDQEDIIIEKISGLDPFTVLCDACKNIIDLFLMTSAFHSGFQPSFLLRLLFRLKYRKIVSFLVYHDVLYDPVSHKECVQDDLIALSKAFS